MGPGGIELKAWMVILGTKIGEKSDTHKLIGELGAFFLLNFPPPVFDVSYLCAGTVLGEVRRFLTFHSCAQAQYLVRVGSFPPRPQHNTVHFR